MTGGGGGEWERVITVRTRGRPSDAGGFTGLVNYVKNRERATVWQQFNLSTTKAMLCK